MSVTVIDKRSAKRADSAGSGMAAKQETPPWFPIFVAVEQERLSQLEKWGVQRLADGTGHPFYRMHADEYRRQNDAKVANGGEPPWSKVLLEEVYEALAEDDTDKLERELIQVAAVAVAWLEDLVERRNKAA